MHGVFLKNIVITISITYIIMFNCYIIDTEITFLGNFKINLKFIVVDKVV